MYGSVTPRRDEFRTTMSSPTGLDTSGLEDNIWYDRNRQRLARNIDLVRRVHRLAEVLERRIMPPEEFRRCMQLEPGNGRYGCHVEAESESHPVPT